MSLNADLDTIIQSVESLQRMLRLPEPPKPPALPSEHLQTLRPRNTTEVNAFRLKQFHEVYQGHEDKDRPIILKSDHIRAIDWMRREYARKNHYTVDKTLATTEIVTACLDVIFSHPNVALIQFEKKEDLSRLICNQIHETAVSHWRQFNEVF